MGSLSLVGIGGKQMVKYDWKKTARKIGEQVLIVFVAGLASVYGNSPYYLAIAPAINGVMNYIKHK